MSNQRTPLVAGNWKMNTTHAEAVALATALAGVVEPAVEIVVCPPFPWLVSVKAVVGQSPIGLGAQDSWPKPNGAFTGGVSIAMLAELCSYVIVGHSERRQHFGETDELVREKVSAVLAGGLTPILCVGESLQTRQAGKANEWVSNQIIAALGGRPEAEISACVIAYEPIWAIGTGVAASAHDAEDMAIEIRRALDSIVPGVSARVRVLYGGSVTAANSAETLGQPNVDGALVGGASLKADQFLQIAKSAAR